MPTPKKPAARRQHQGDTKLVAVADIPVLARDVPPCPDDWLAVTKERWDRFWLSPLAKTAHEVDFDAVETYFGVMDEIRRCRNGAKGKRLVEGSTGQPRLNPLLDRADKLTALLPRLWAELGLSPKARAALAINVGQAQKTIDDLNREVDDADDDDWGDSAEVVEPVADDA